MSTRLATIRPAVEDDAERLLAAHAAAFGEGTPERPPRTAAGLRWRLLENPAGAATALAVDDAGEVVAYQAGLPRRARLAGEERTFLLLVDSLVVPEACRGLRNPGPFVATAKELLSRHGGLGDGLAPVVYGLPTRAARRIGQARLGLELVRNQNRLVATPEMLRPGSSGCAVEEVEAFPEEVDELFARAGARYEAVAVRDRAFLDWRFTRNPERSYRIALARAADGGLAGYAVWTRGGLDGLEGGLVADWLVDPAATAPASALVAWLADVARAEGTEHVQALLPETCDDFVGLQREGFRVEPTSVYLAARSWSRRQDMLWLYWNWYYTLADFDRS